MKKITAIILTAALLAALTGCDKKGTSEDSANTNSSSMSSTVDSTSLSSDNSEPQTPEGKPTFLIGPDGNPVYSGEITRLENTDKIADTLTEDDLWAEVYCDGFAYVKEPTGVGYNNYKNPEMFNGFDFLSEMPENKNPWKRVNVGDEICGLKVKTATSHFMVNDFDEYKFPARYYGASNSFCELEGTVVAEGFLQVNNRSDEYFINNELMWFYPSGINLPITPSIGFVDNENGFETPSGVYGIFHHSTEFLFTDVFDSISLGCFSDVNCDMDGIGVGDVAYARVTLGNIKCSGGTIGATIEKVERLSEILAHDEDDTKSHQTAPIL